MIVSAMIFGALFTSCIENDDIDNGNLKLLETIKYDGQGYDKFEYDNQNRITKISSFGSNENLLEYITFHYSGNNYTVKLNNQGITFEFNKKENKIIRTSTGTVDGKPYTSTFTYTMELNGDGLPFKIIFETGNTNMYQYQSGNLINNSYSHLTGSNEFKYDDKKSPLYNSKTPKTWFWTKIGFWGFWDHGLLLISKNNIIEAKNNTVPLYDVVKYEEYSYDSDGFPTKCKVTRYSQVIQIEFTY